MKNLKFNYLLIAFFTLFILSSNTSIGKKTDLVGTWQICRPDYSPETKLGGREGTTRYLIIGQNTVVIAEAAISEKTFIAMFIGTYSIDNDNLMEQILYTNPGLKSYKDKVLNYQIELKDSFLIKKGIDNPYNEIWKRIKL